MDPWTKIDQTEGLEGTTTEQDAFNANALKEKLSKIKSKFMAIPIKS